MYILELNLTADCISFVHWSKFVFKTHISLQFRHGYLNLIHFHLGFSTERSGNFLATFVKDK